MAKKDLKKSDGTTTTSNDTAAVAAAPVFSADALSKLTQRIQSDFEKAKSSGGKAGRKDRKKGKDKEKSAGGKKPSDKSPGKPLPSSGPSTAAPKGKSGDTKGDKRDPQPPQSDRFKDSQKPQQREAKPEPSSRPTKQQKRESRPVPQWQPQRTKPGPSTGNKPPKDKDPFPKKAGSSSVDQEALLKEILELGGTAEDLALVDGIASDEDEEEGLVVKESGKPKDVQVADIEAFMKEIGLANAELLDVDDEVSEAGDDSDEEADSGEVEDEDKSEAEGESEDGGASEGAGGDVEMGEAEPAPATTSTTKNPKLVFHKRPDWHAEPLPPLTAPAQPLTPREIEPLHERAKALLQTENSVYSKTELVKSSDRQFLSQIMQGGTLTDKISALTLICQESPLHTTKTLQSLLGLAQKKSKSQSIQALGAIKDLFAQGVCLPPNRKLKFFAKQPMLGAKGMSDIHLLVWAYEDWLKNFYFEVLKCLEQLCTDQLVYARTHAVGYVYTLLKEKPEQEANLLRVLVNKLGDSDKKVASKVSYLLLQLTNAHPAMKSIVIKAIESEVVFKPGNHTNAKYYSIITLNQTVLSSMDHDVANTLLDIYFGVFTSLLHKENTQPILTGGNATGKGSHLKFVDEKKQEKDDKKLNKKARLRAQREEEQSQFEEESNAKLVSAVLTGVNRAFPFSQVDDEIFAKHMDTLFRVTHQGNFNTSVQALILIFQVSNAKQAVSDRFYRTLYESLLDQRLITSSKQALYLNLLFRALKSDTSIKRVKAFVKRILQVATLHQPSFICGILYLLSELEVNMPSIRTLITDPEPSEDDDEEVFRDVPDEDNDETPAAPSPKPAALVARPMYDGRKRDPLHASADRSCLWELLPFLSHFHPTVALFAECLLEKRPMPSKPDLGMHTLTHFLDRFVYRNPKTVSASTRGTSIMQPLAGGKSVGMVLSTRGSRAQVPVNSEAFWKKKIEDVKPEEVFFHHYFNITRPGEKLDKKRKRDDDNDEGSDSDAEGEIWKALVDSNRELEGSDEEGMDFDDDDDLEISDDDDDVGTGNDEDLELGDDDEEWGTEDSDDEMEPTGGAAADFEAQLTKASAKRQKMLDADSDDGDDGGVRLVSAPVKGAGGAQGSKKEKKKKLKALPTFASMEDYADMLSD